MTDILRAHLAKLAASTSKPSDLEINAADYEEIAALFNDGAEMAKQAKEAGDNSKDEASRRTFQAYLGMVQRMAHFKSLGKRDKEKKAIKSALEGFGVKASKAKRLVEMTTNLLLRMPKVEPDLVRLAREGKGNEVAAILAKPAYGITTEASLAKWLSPPTEKSLADKVKKLITTYHDDGDEASVAAAAVWLNDFLDENGYRPPETAKPN